jgi:type II secretion system protein N
MTHDSMTDDSIAIPDATPDSAPESFEETVEDHGGSSSGRMRRMLRIAGWSALALGLLGFFTLVKIPEQRIKELLNAHLANALSGMGYTLTSSESRLTIGFGIRYELEAARLTSGASGQTARFESVTVRPRLLPLLLGKLGATIELREGSGRLHLSVAGRPPAARSLPLDLSLEAESFDFGRAQLGPFLSGVGVSGVLNGKASLKGDFEIPSSLSGTIELKATQLGVEASRIEGFPVPRLSLTELQLDGKIENSRLTLTTARIGKPAGGDDLSATIRGNLLLGKSWNEVTLDLKTQFKFSDAVKKAVPPLELFLTPGLGADGSYQYSLSGPLSAPNPQPIK